MSLATRLIEDGQLELAESYLRSALAKAPTDAELLFDAANLKRAQGEIDACLTILRRIGSDQLLGMKAALLLDILAQRPSDRTDGRHIAPVPFARYENVLPAPAIDALLAFVVANEARFEDSMVKAIGRIDLNARRSKVWRGITALPTGLADVVAGAVAANTARLGVHEPLADRFELEIGAYRDGDFFAPHWDRGDGATRVRRITTLFYFHAQPPQFSGGQLQLFDTGANGEFDRAGWTGFPPTGNTMLQFRSEAIHAVTPVHGPARFADSRFCLTFWAHQRH